MVADSSRRNHRGAYIKSIWVEAGEDGTGGKVGGWEGGRVVRLVGCGGEGLGRWKGEMVGGYGKRVCLCATGKPGGGECGWWRDGGVRGCWGAW